MASEKWSNPTVCLVPMSWPTEYARHLDVCTTSIYPLPKMSPDRALGNSVSLGDSSDSGSLGNIIQCVLVGLLVLLSITSYLRRETSEPPRWLGAMQHAKPRTAFMAGLLLLSVFPSDFVILVTVGVNLVQNNASLLAAVPFIAATIFIE